MTEGTKKSNKLNVLDKLNFQIVIAAALIMLICFIDTKTNVTSQLTTEIEPFSVAYMADGSKEYFFDLRDFDWHYSGVMFYTAHQQVKGYYNGREIYNFTKTGGVWTDTCGSSYHFIEINDKMPQIAVIVTPIYDVVKDQKLTFYVGSSYEMYNDIMSASMPKLVVSILIILLSSLIFIYYILMHEKQQLDKNLLYLGYFSFFCGIWFANECDAINLLIKNKIMDSLVPYLCLMLVVPPFIVFFDSYLELRSKYMKKIMCSLSMLQIIVLTFLHFTKIAEFRETLPFIQGMMVAALVYMVVGMFIKIHRREITRHTEICAVGLTLFASAGIFDIVAYYQGLGDADVIGRYEFLIFAFMLAWDMISDANEIIETGRRAKQLEVFALTDSMTGLFNRNAFESHAQTERNLEGLVAVVADANGLKRCNDTFGHEAGDEYITTVANIFNSVYGKYGNCYRTGGDEFCCIIPANRQVNKDRLRNLFCTKISTANIEGRHEFDIAVAIGDAKYDRELDDDFRSLVKRADAHMYENKRIQKSS